MGLSECSSYADLIIVDLKDGRSTWCVDIIQVISVGVFWFLRKYFVSLKTSRLGDTLGHLGTSITSEKRDIKNDERGASLVAQWLRICLLMQGTRVRALVWEDPTCHGAAGPVSHNC